MTQEFYIKNMVCDRCIKILRNELEGKGLAVQELELGRVILRTKNRKPDIISLLKVLHSNGFLLISSENQKLVEAVKIELITLLRNLPLVQEGKLSEFLAQRFQTDYSKISKIFSSTEKVTVEKYFIKLKIEKVKELIQDGQYNFTQIGQSLNYNNVNYLSRQFKAETGINLSQYKSLKNFKRNSLDQIV
jgi:AraC-like DNA-binding protein